MLAELTGAEVVHHTRGGARLAEQLNPKTKTGAKTQAALENEFWDYVVLQEMSNGPVTSRNSFLKNIGRLCAWIKEEGASPLLFATWAYQKDSQAMADMDMSYDEMAQGSMSWPIPVICMQRMASIQAKQVPASLPKPSLQ